jgi:GAF domain-containing protein
VRHVRLSEISGAAVDTSGGLACNAARSIADALAALRCYLNTDVAFVCQFIGKKRVFRNIDTKTGRSPFKVGDVLPLDGSFCIRVVEGGLPPLIQDASACVEAMAILETRDIPIGAHLGVPVLLDDGRVYGALCCLSFAADPSLNERDLKITYAVADAIAGQVEKGRRDAINERASSAIGLFRLDTARASSSCRKYQLSRI